MAVGHTPLGQCGEHGWVCGHITPSSPHNWTTVARTVTAASPKDVTTPTPPPLWPPQNARIITATLVAAAIQQHARGRHRTAAAQQHPALAHSTRAQRHDAGGIATAHAPPPLLTRTELTTSHKNHTHTGTESSGCSRTRAQCPPPGHTMPPQRHTTHLLPGSTNRNSAGTPL